MYSYIVGLDEEIWDVLEDDVGDWPLMKKELVLTERNTLLLKRIFTRSITRSEEILLLPCLVLCPHFGPKNTHSNSSAIF